MPTFEAWASTQHFHFWTRSSIKKLLRIVAPALSFTFWREFMRPPNTLLMSRTWYCPICDSIKYLVLDGIMLISFLEDMLKMSIIGVNEHWRRYIFSIAVQNETLYWRNLITELTRSGCRVRPIIKWLLKVSLWIM